MQIGLIAEGASEIGILKHIVCRYLGSDCDINTVQPEIDDKGTQTSAGGWNKVIKTFECEGKIKEILIENQYVLIQIDTDCAHIAPFSVRVLDDNGQCCTNEELHKRVRERILSHIPNLTTEEKNRILLAICIHEIECWLLPVYYNDNKRCKTTNCIDLLNHELRKHKIDIITEKNDGKARKTYYTILKKLNKKDIIEEYAQYNVGFRFFLEQLKSIRNSSEK